MSSTGWRRHPGVDLTDADRDALAATSRRIVAANRYMTLSTADASGRPWVSPVYFTPDGDRRLLWVSSPTARHSRNIADRPDVAVAIFDSTVAIGHAEAVYCSARAGLVPDADVATSLALFSAREEDAAITLDEVRPPGGRLRLYQAVASEVSVLLRGSDPRNPHGIDTRVVLP